MHERINKMIRKTTTLLTAFSGTSSETLVSRFDKGYRKIILENNKNESAVQLVNALENNNINYIISFGQKPVIKDKIYIEIAGRNGDTLYNTAFDTGRLSEALREYGFSVHISSNAGTSFCNHIYTCGLKYISENNYSAKMVFVHVPFEKNISDFDDYSDRLIKAVNDFLYKMRPSINPF